MRRTPRLLTCCAALLPLLALPGCETPPDPSPDAGANPGAGAGSAAPAPGGPGPGGESQPGVGQGTAGVTTRAVDAFDETLARGLADGERLQVYGRRWLAVRRAVAHAGVDHEGAFFAGRGYWHTGYLRGGDWSWEHPRDLDEPIFVDGRGTVLVWGDAEEDITITGDAVVHILGDLGATVSLRGSGEVVVAGSVRPGGRILAGGTLDLYTGGDCAGEVTAKGSCTAVIDGDLIGRFTAGQPATTLHVTGDCVVPIARPAEAASLLTLRVDGAMPSAQIEATMAAGFTRVTASIVTSDTDPGLYPAPGQTQPSRSRWVVHRRGE